MEEVHHNPDIVIYYNVISDLEIETVQKLAKPRVNSFQIKEYRPNFN
jgi:hypothetical protein